MHSKKNNFNEKGFIITVDSFLALTLVAVFVIVAFGFISLVRIDSWNSVDLKNSSSDVSSILKSTGTINNALLGSSTEGILEILNNTPGNICFESMVFDSDSNIVLHSIKTGCIKNSTQVFSSERLIVLNDSGTISFFISRINGWFK